jgi:probable F420-dependent oxidoreductase
MVTLAAEVADGMTAHAFTTERYLREVVLPRLEAGLGRTGRTRDQFQLSCAAFVVTGRTENEMQAALTEARKQIASYAAIGTVQGYRQVLEYHGWGRLQPTLNLLAKEGQWDEMGRFVDDEMLQAFAVVGEPSQLAAKLVDRFDGFADRVRCYTPSTTDRKWFDETVANAMTALRGAPRSQLRPDR